jgi:hypothetical protein
MPISRKHLWAISFARISYFSKRIADKRPWHDVGNLGRCLVTAAQEIATPKTFSQSFKWVFFVPLNGCDTWVREKFVQIHSATKTRIVFF